jgi:hypothetical protein
MKLQEIQISGFPVNFINIEINGPRDHKNVCLKCLTLKSSYVQRQKGIPNFMLNFLRLLLLGYDAPLLITPYLHTYNYNVDLSSL